MSSDKDQAKLKRLGWEALRKVGHDPSRAIDLFAALMSDQPTRLHHLIVEKLDAKPAQRMLYNSFLHGLVREDKEAAAAAREEARRGQQAPAAKAMSTVPAAPRLNDGDGGHILSARESQVWHAASPSPFGEVGGRQGDAEKAKSLLPSSSPSERTRAGHPPLAGKGHGTHALPGAPKTTGEAGRMLSAEKARVAVPASPVASKPIPIPIKHGLKNESPAQIASKIKAMDRRAEVWAPTWSVYDGRDLMEVMDTELAEINRRSVAACRQQMEKYGRMVVETGAQLLVQGHLGTPQGKLIKQRMSCDEAIAIRNRAEMLALAGVDAGIDALMDKAREMGLSKSPSLPLFQETLKLIGGTTNAA